VIDPSYGASLHAFRKAVTAALRDVRLTQTSEGFWHEPLVPLASYAPWRQDLDFCAVYEKIQGHTLVDLYRCFELWNLGRQMRRLPGDVLEVGVWRGGTAGILGRAVISAGAHCHLWLADTFEGVPRAGAQDTRYKGGEHADTSEDVVRTLLRDLEISEFTILRGVFPEDTAHAMGDTRLKLCHIDVDIYASAKSVFTWVWDRLVPGGLVVFDDYGFWGCEGVTRFGNELQERGIGLIYNLNGHAVVYRAVAE
jgi:O-methyltransferase